jgi:hypothetical protein
MVRNFQAAIRSLVDQDVWTIAAASAPTDGTSGDGAGITGPGSFYIDTANAVAYINTGTKDSPTWTELGSVVNSSVVMMPNLPTADPSVAGQLWSNAGVVTVSAG